MYGIISDRRGYICYTLETWKTVHMLQRLRSYCSPNMWLSGESNTSVVCFVRSASDHLRWWEYFVILFSLEYLTLVLVVYIF